MDDLTTPPSVGRGPFTEGQIWQRRPNSAPIACQSGTVLPAPTMEILKTFMTRSPLEETMLVFCVAQGDRFMRTSSMLPHVFQVQRSDVERTCDLIYGPRVVEVDELLFMDRGAA